MGLCIYVPGYNDRAKPCKRESYGCFHEVTPEQAKGQVTYLLPDLMSGGDYSNTSLVHKSNHRSFLARFGKVDGVHDLYGGYGTFAIAIRSDVAESNSEIKDVLEGLDNYPLMDEDDHSNLELEAQDEAWKDWARNAFVHFLLAEEFLGDYDEDSLARVIRRKVFKTTAKKCKDVYVNLFYQSAENIGAYWKDDGGSMHIDVDKVAGAAIETLLIHLLPRNELPLLIGRKWHSKEAQQALEAVMKAGT